MNRFFAFILLLLPIGLCSQTPLFQTGNTTITSLAVSPNGRTVAVEGDAGDITLWDLSTRKKIMTLKRIRAATEKDEEEDATPDMSAILNIGFGATSRMRFTPDGQKLVLSYNTGAIVWGIKEEKQLYEIKALSDFYDIEASARYLTVVKEALKQNQRYWEPADIGRSENWPHESTIILYDIQSGSEKELALEALSKVKRIRFVPGSSGILIAGLKGNISLIDYISGKKTEMKPIYKEDEELSAVSYEIDDLPAMPVATIAMHPSDKIVAVSNSTNKIHIYDFKSEKIKSIIQISNTTAMPGQGLEHLEFAPNGKYLFGTYRSLADKGLKKQLRFWDVETGKEVKSMVIDPVLSGFSFSADGKYFALTKMDSSKKPPSVICIFDAHTLAEFESFQGRGIPAFFPNDPKRMVFSLVNGIGVHTLKQ
jgi:WD40 repeat protein